MRYEPDGVLNVYETSSRAVIKDAWIEHSTRTRLEDDGEKESYVVRRANISDLQKIDMVQTDSYGWLIRGETSLGTAVEIRLTPHAAKKLHDLMVANMKKLEEE